MTKEEKIYPRPPREPNWHLDRRWVVEFNDMVYDNGVVSWERGFRTRWGARIAAWWTYYVASWGGGSVTITDTRAPVAKEPLCDQDSGRCCWENIEDGAACWNIGACGCKAIAHSPSIHENEGK